MALAEKPFAGRDDVMHVTASLDLCKQEVRQAGKQTDMSDNKVACVCAFK